jgi:hypothetical protein
MGVLRRTVIMKLTGEVPAEAKFTITVRRIHLVRRPCDHALSGGADRRLCLSSFVKNVQKIVKILDHKKIFQK